MICAASCSRVGLIPARAGKTDGHRGRPPPSPAHPRAGGENSGRAVRFWSCRGSSPRGRGKPASHRATREIHGLIPARAGKTRARRTLMIMYRAHPRAGGENFHAQMTGAIPWGSSPRGRGKHRAHDSHGARGRLIPARAGKTVSRISCRRSTAAHPRAGGENEAAIQAGADTAGSSPRGRGKRLRGGRVLFRPRLIPARAGKTTVQVGGLGLRAAHPRAGGENLPGRRTRRAV